MVEINKIIEKFWDEVIKHRRWLHAHPELSGQEEKTSEYIASVLKEMGIEPKTGVGGFGVVGLINGKAEGKCVALRADFDALPLTECTSLPFQSENEGVFHACGHDTHTAMLLGAAYVLNEMRDSFSGTVKLIFQPSEENAADSGAKKMIMDGVLENPKVDAIFAQHMSPHYRTGEIVVRNGAMTASSDRFFIKIRGKSSHGSEPEGGIDAIAIGAQVITALQTIVSRSISPLDNTVVSIGKVSGGNKYNVIADKFDMEGTCRTTKQSIRENMPRHIESIVKGIAEGMGGRYEFSFVPGYPPTINNSEQFELIKDVAQGVIGTQNVIIPQDTTLTGEDFSFYGEKVPAGFYWLGCRKEDDEFYPLHSEKFSPDENAMKIGMEIMINSAINYLNK